jgi:hypothetical protein
MLKAVCDDFPVFSYAVVTATFCPFESFVFFCKISVFNIPAVFAVATVNAIFHDSNSLKGVIAYLKAPHVLSAG